LDWSQIQEFYDLAQELQWLSEEKLEVDHIIPLQGEHISGLHLSSNLQILPKSLNGSKNDKFNQQAYDKEHLPLLISKLPK